jgi:predicted RNA-binding Zn ribbon-like protein
VNDPALIVALANARAPRKPTGARARVEHDALADAALASELLAPFLGRAVTAPELPAVRELQAVVVAAVDALIEGSAVPLAALNRLFAQYPCDRGLVRQPDGTLRATTEVRRGSAAAILTHRAIDELDGLDVTRLRRCGRPECRLVYYDRSRSGTQRWHSERPCGLRERQRRHRAAGRDSSGGVGVSRERAPAGATARRTAATARANPARSS